MHNEYYDVKCKDSSPLKTINRIKDILGSLGILAKEQWLYQIEGFYSVSISVFGTSFASNGKGTTPAYALASAYGEFMERLQNLFLNNMKLDTSGDVLQYGNYYFAPDEKHLGIDEIAECKHNWAKAFTLNTAAKEEKTEILKKWLIEDNTGKPQDFISIPFVNIKDGELHYLPKVMLFSLYGSNGMCAGNTPEEALVQGFSEVMERHAHAAISKNRIVPPTIPHSYLEQYPKVSEMINRVERQGNFKIIVKDCSLGEGLPVIAIILTDRERHTYSVRFGAHPLFEIAVERCLTELLQGRDFKDMYWLNKFSYYNKDADSFRNYKSQVTVAMGCYDTSLFTEKFSYTFKAFKKLETYSNKHMLYYLYNILKNKGYDILVRDVSFLGFPAYHVVVPSFSEIPDLSIKTIITYSTAMKVKRIARNLKHSTDEELLEIISYMLHGDDESFTYQDSIVKILDLPLMNGFPWHGMKKDIFIASAYYRMGRLHKAYETMDSYIQSADMNKKDVGITYFKCVRDYFGMRADGISDEDQIKNLLKVFYTENMVCKVIAELRDPNDVFKNCESLNCFKCSDCEWQKCCLYPKMKKIHMQLKDEYAENVIDQHGVMKYFDA